MLTKAGVNWSDFQVLSRAGVNWGDILALSKTGVNWSEVLIRIGAYQKGSDREIDEAIDKKGLIESFLKQDKNEKVEFDDTVAELVSLKG